MLWHRGKAYSQDLRERVFTAGEIASVNVVEKVWLSEAVI